MLRLSGEERVKQGADRSARSEIPVRDRQIMAVARRWASGSLSGVVSLDLEEAISEREYEERPARVDV